MAHRDLSTQCPSTVRPQGRNRIGDQTPAIHRLCYFINLFHKGTYNNYIPYIWLNNGIDNGYNARTEYILPRFVSLGKRYLQLKGTHDSFAEREKYCAVLGWFWHNYVTPLPGHRLPWYWYVKCECSCLERKWITVTYDDSWLKNDTKYKYTYLLKRSIKGWHNFISTHHVREISRTINSGFWWR